MYHDNRVFGLEPPVRWICKAIDEISKPPDWILRPDSRPPPKGVDEQALSEARTMLGGFLDGAALVGKTIYIYQQGVNSVCL